MPAKKTRKKSRSPLNVKDLAKAAKKGKRKARTVARKASSAYGFVSENLDPVKKWLPDPLKGVWEKAKNTTPGKIVTGVLGRPEYEKLREEWMKRRLQASGEVEKVKKKLKKLKSRV